MTPREAVRTLGEAGIPDAAGDVRRLFDWAFGQGRGQGPQDPDTPNAATQAAFEQAIAARLARKPVSQIIGRRAFWKHEFLVTSDVLDPRPDTETLVEHALAAPFTRVLDLGTGSGCILLSLLADRPGATGLGTDLSLAALQIAKQNAAALGLSDRAAFRQADWLAGVEGKFDLIVSNPPYIATTAYEGLPPELRLHEPKSALTPGGDGLDAYRSILAQAPAHLRSGGRLMVEIGHDQGSRVTAFFKAAGLEQLRVITDLNGKDRVVSGRVSRAAGLDISA